MINLELTSYDVRDYLNTNFKSYIIKNTYNQKKTFMQNIF